MHRIEFPEIEVRRDQEVRVRYTDHKGSSREKRVALMGLAAFILNSVQPSVGKIAPQDLQGNQVASHKEYK